MEIKGKIWQKLSRIEERDEIKHEILYKLWDKWSGVNILYKNLSLNLNETYLSNTQTQRHLQNSKQITNITLLGTDEQKSVDTIKI